ncbi:MAG: hypothetical protein WC198_07820 [Victivallaceae bacterium]
MLKYFEGKRFGVRRLTGSILSVRICTALNFSLLLLSGITGNSVSADSIQVKTRAPENKTATFNYRVPKGYDGKRCEMYRVLVIFGWRV